jgi:hypothetical protein
MPTLADILGAVDAAKRGMSTNPLATLKDYGRGAVGGLGDLGDLLLKMSSPLQNAGLGDAARELTGSTGVPVEKLGEMLGLPGIGPAAKGLTLAGIMGVPVQRMGKKALEELIAKTVRGGGATLDIAKGTYPTSGYVVGGAGPRIGGKLISPPTENSIDLADLTPNALQKLLQQNPQLMSTGTLGTWINKGRVVVDPVDVMPAFRARIATKNRGQIANYNLRKGEEDFGGLDPSERIAQREAMKNTRFGHEMSTRYPQTMVPVEGIEKASGKPYAAKNVGPEAQRVAAIRDAAQADIDAGNYTPHFDISKREHVPPGAYPTDENTLDAAIPKTFPTFDKWAQEFDTPEVRANLNKAFDAGKGGENWYAMKQLYDEFIKELGPVEGAAKFKERFADSMTATTGGSDPKANLLTGTMANFYKEKGIPFPKNRDESIASFDLPYPVGGRYVAGNIDMADKTLMRGLPITAEEQPKRFNFSGNFLGRRDPATIDEQMMTLFDPVGRPSSPPGDSYGVLESILGDEAAKRGLPGSNFQDVAWLGAKRMKGDADAVSRPMMQHVNEMLERTSRVTGLPVADVLKGLIRGNMPMYGIGGITLTDLMRRGADASGDQ